LEVGSRRQKLDKQEFPKQLLDVWIVQIGGFKFPIGTGGISRVLHI
jgi:hypothetical protein